MNNLIENYHPNL